MAHEGIIENLKMLQHLLSGGEYYIGEYYIDGFVLLTFVKPVWLVLNELAQYKTTYFGSPKCCSIRSYRTIKPGSL